MPCGSGAPSSTGMANSHPPPDSGAHTSYPTSAATVPERACPGAERRYGRKPGSAARNCTNAEARYSVVTGVPRAGPDSKSTVIVSAARAGPAICSEAIIANARSAPAHRLVGRDDVAARAIRPAFTTASPAAVDCANVRRLHTGVNTENGSSRWSTCWLRSGPHPALKQSAGLRPVHTASVGSEEFDDPRGRSALRSPDARAAPRAADGSRLADHARGGPS
jgi:hypothetical protein